MAGPDRTKKETRVPDILRGAVLRPIVKKTCAVLIALISGLLLVSPACPAEGETAEKIAIFPFENFSGDKNALASVMPLLKSRLAQKGFEVVKEDDMNAFLLKERIRTSGYVSRDVARKIGEALGADLIITGSVNTFAEGGSPRTGFTVFVISTSDGSLMWANHSAATGEDFEGILGLGKIGRLDEISERVLDALLKPLKRNLPDKNEVPAYKIAVMPFQNKCRVGNAGMMVTYMFIAELFKSGKFRPLEFGDVRRLVVDLRMKDKGEIDLKNAEAVAGATGVDGIVIGCIDTYREGSGIEAPPEVNISARLITAGKGLLLWCGSSHVKGDDSVFMLDWGRIRSPENVAYKAVTRLAADMGKTKWR